MKYNRTLWLVIAIVAVVMLVGGVALAQRGGFSAPSVNPAAPVAKNPSEAKILAVLDKMVSANETYLEIHPHNGRMLRLLAESIDAKQVAEIGTSTGFSGLWLSLALANTGGRLTTFEIDAKRAAQARAHFEQAGVEKIITIVVGDAHQNIKSLKAPLDLVFIDADKEGYPDYLNRLLPLVRPGGLLVADNIGMARQYAAAISANRDLDTVYVDGMAITLKKR